MPVKYARTTTSTRKGAQRRMTDTFGCGTDTSALGQMSRVTPIQYALTRLSTAPLCGMTASCRSKAESRSVVTSTTTSPTSYVSRTLPARLMPNGSAVARISAAASAGDAAAADICASSRGAATSAAVRTEAFRQTPATEWPRGLVASRDKV